MPCLYPESGILFDSIPLGIVIQDAVGAIVGANPAAERILGLSLDQMRGRTSADSGWHAVREDGSPFPGCEHPAMVTLRTGQAVNDVVMGIRSPRGEALTWINIKSVPIDTGDDQPPAGVYTLFEDITARKAAEAELRLRTHFLEVAQRMAQLGYYVTDIQAQRWVSSPMLDEVLGIDQDFDRTVENWSRLVHPEDRHKATAEFTQAAQGRRNLHHQYRIIRPRDGQIRWVDAWGSFECRDGQAWCLIGTVKDITERMEAQLELERHRDQLELLVARRARELENKTEALVRTSERLRLAMEATRDGLWDWSPVTGEFYANDAFFRMLGYERPMGDRNLLPHAVALLSRRERKAVIGRIQRELRSAGHYELELRMRASSGAYRWILSRGRVVERDSRGDPVRVVGTHVDITERKQAERQIRESREKLMLAIDGARLGTWHWDIPSNVLLWSDYMCELFGAPPGRPLRYEGFLAALHPDDRESVDAAIRASLERGVHYEKEYRVVWPDGSEHWILGVGRVYRNAAGQPLRMEGVVSDITERKQAQQELQAKTRLLQETNDRLRKMAARVPGIIFQYRLRPDGSSCFPYASEAIRDIYGVEPAAVREDASPVFATLHPQDLAPVSDSIRRSAEALAPWQMEYRVLGGDGAVRWVFGDSVPEREADGSILWHGCIYDITERKQAELALRELNLSLEQKVQERTAQLAAASAAKTQFLAHMSHEIRTPMNAVLGLAQLLSREPLSPGQLTMVRHLGEAGDALLNIIDDILDFSKIEAGQLRIDVQAFSVATVLERVRHLFQNSAAAKGLDFRVNSPAATALGTLRGDPRRIEQILINLLGNAIKFTATGGVELVILPQASADDAVRLRFEVRDTGIGVAPEALSRLFQPFSQGDASITRRFGGTGLGLAISQRLVRLMGGTLGAESRPGQGSTFWFELPFARDGESPPVPVAAPSPVGARLAGLRVLAVDDNRINLLVLARALQQAGALTILVADGQQALDRLRATPDGFDVVLMDIQMPVMDGLTATREIRRDADLAHLPVIALTAGVLAEEREAALRAGVDDFLAKPLDMARLQDLLSRYLGSAREAAVV